MIETKHLSVMFQKKTVLKDVNFKVNDNDFWLIFGPNGAGKTTLLKTLAGQIKDFSGSIRIDGSELSSYSAKQIAKKIAFLPQEDHFGLPFRVYDILLFGRYPYLSLFSNYSSVDRKIVLETASEFGLIELLERDIQTLSGGEKKKVLIASAFLQHVSTFLLDEPLNFLDPPSIQKLLYLLKSIFNQGKTIIVVSHFIEYFLPLVTKIFALNNGNTIYCGEKTFNNDLMQKVYGVSFSKTWLESRNLVFLNE